MNLRTIFMSKDSDSGPIDRGNDTLKTSLNDS